MEIRNIAIIAHVDHGKTTLVDAMLHQCNVFSAHENVESRVMDSMDLERERGITITSKNTAITYKNAKINIVDSPGHADFGGEVERVLSMVEGALLLVDASEGPLPQTRFVLSKAMEAGLVLMVCINKIDRDDARIEEVIQEVYDLFIDLGADDELLDFPILYACAKQGLVKHELEDESDNVHPLLDKILEAVPPPKGTEKEGAPKLLVTNLDYDPYVGRLAIGRLFGAPIRRGDTVRYFHQDGDKNVKLQLLYTWNGLKRQEVKEVMPGDIIALGGIEDITVGDSICGGEAPQALARLKVDEPTIGMTFSINDSPMAGRNGTQLTSRQIKERLERELLKNVSLRLDPAEHGEVYKVFGRGELQLSILIEQMRREGFELTVSRPEAVRREVDGVMHEPFEIATIDLPDDYVGVITQRMAHRKGQLQDMVADGGGRTRMVYRIPSRGLIGFRGELLTDTRGEGIINALFDGWDKEAGFIQSRVNGALVADRTGKTTAYALFHLQPRGELMVKAQVEVYEGMIIGIHKRENDLNVNAVKGKALNNVRTAGADEKLILSTPRALTLESAFEFIDDNERVEITPSHIRLRKKVLASNMRSIVRRAKEE